MDRTTYLLEQLKFWEQDPLPAMLATMTADQNRFYLDPARCLLCEGGNQSGKSRSTILKAVAFALEEIDGSFPGQDVNIWYCTTTYDSFAGPAWTHFKNALLFPGESTAKLPATRLEAVNWLGKAPEKPNYFCINRPSGKKAHVHVKSYAQGRGEFQGQTLHLIVLDEECPEEIYTEIMARMFASRGARLFVTCTPVEGMDWLDILRKDAEEGKVSRYQLKTLDNPACNLQVVEDLKRQYANNPEELKLRLEGVARAGSGLVYKDTNFTPEHTMSLAHFRPDYWTLNRAIDAGYRHPACVWIAVSPDEKQVVVYRTWKGKDCTIAEAAKEINRLSGAERYHWNLIDPAVCQTNAETGKPELAVWRANHVDATPAPDNTVHSGIERVWALMAERVEIPDSTGTGTVIKPRFRVIRETCQEWLDERRKYRFKDLIKDNQRDIIDFRPVKQHDHLMDPTRYLVAAGLSYVPEAMRPPEKDSYAYQFWVQRHKPQKNRRR